MEEHVRSVVRQFIVDSWLSGDARGFDDRTDLLESGILDSFATLSLIGFLEETFKVQLDPADVNPSTFATVDTIARLVLQKTST